MSTAPTVAQAPNPQAAQAQAPNPQAAVAQTAATQPQTEQQQESKGKRGKHNKPVFPLPKNADGTEIKLDFFPNEANKGKCAELGIPVWSAEKYRVISKGSFTIEAIPLEEQANRLEKKVAKLRETAAEIRRNPEQSTQIRKVRKHYEQFTELLKALEESGTDTSQMKADLAEKFGKISI